MKLYEIHSADNEKLVVQTFFSQITIVCLGICVKWHNLVHVYIESFTPIPSQVVQYLILLNDLYNICYGATKFVFSEAYLVNLNISGLRLQLWSEMIFVALGSA